MKGFIVVEAACGDRHIICLVKVADFSGKTS